MISCRCGAIWTGLGRCHCSGCHITVGGITAFDAHRRSGKCLKPKTIGLHENDQGVWVGTYGE